MAVRTVQQARRFDLVSDEQPLSLGNLVGRRLPVHIKDVLTRTNKVLRMAMAVDAPVHFQGLRSPRQWHLIYVAVTR